MKYIYSILLLVVLFAFGRNLRPADKEGIIFFKGSWQEALKEAQKENKPLFLDIYTTWCGPCKMLKRYTFTNKKVASFYNGAFINLSLDAEKGEGKEFAEKYQISAVPTLLYFDKTGKPVLYATGFVEPKEFIDIGNQAIQKAK
jgi:thiol:disulfide interchange protein